MTGWPWLWPPQPTRRPFLQGSKGSLAFRVSRSLPPLHLKPAETVLAPKALPETLVSPAAVARYDQGKEGLLGCASRHLGLFPGLGPSTCPKAAASQDCSQRGSREEATAAPAPGVPRAHALGSREASPHSSARCAHRSGRGAPGLSGFPHPTLPTNPEISKPQWGLFLLFLTLGFLAACFHFPIYSSALILNLRKRCPSFPRKHKAMSLSASYVARPVSGTFSGSF